MKAKIMRLYYEPQHHLFLDNDDQNKVEDEASFLHHVLKRLKMQESRMVNSIYNDRNIQTHANEHPTHLHNIDEREI